MTAPPNPEPTTMTSKCASGSDGGERSVTAIHSESRP